MPNGKKSFVHESEAISSYIPTQDMRALIVLEAYQVRCHFQGWKKDHSPKNKKREARNERS